VPAYHSLLLQVPWQALLRPGAAAIQQQITQWCQQPDLWQPTTTRQETQVLEVPVCYHSSLSTDWPLVEAATGLSAHQVIALHTQPLYQVYMIGFLPGFAYMGPVHPAIAVERKAQPTPVTAGAVGIAGSQTGIYPTHSPGGWHIIGHTPLQLFNTGWPQPALLQPGQLVRLQPISIEEYYQLKRQPT
jgi:inhibitor of KinA